MLACQRGLDIDANQSEQFEYLKRVVVKGMLEPNPNDKEMQEALVAKNASEFVDKFLFIDEISEIVKAINDKSVSTYGKDPVETAKN